MLSRVSRSRILCRNNFSGSAQMVNVRGLSTQESYTEKQIKKGRPVSPHVTIYKFPLAAITSITNRVTGVILSVGNIFL